MAPAKTSYLIWACAVLQCVAMTMCLRCFVCESCFRVNERTEIGDGCYLCVEDMSPNRSRLERLCIKTPGYDCPEGQYCCSNRNLCNSHQLQDSASGQSSCLNPFKVRIVALTVILIIVST